MRLIASVLDSAVLEYIFINTTKEESVPFPGGKVSKLPLLQEAFPGCLQSSWKPGVVPAY